MEDASHEQDPPRTRELLERARAGDREALDALLETHRDRLGRMIRGRMADAVRRRIDASDVVQETYIEASRRLDEFLESRDPERPMSFFFWLRWLARERLISLQRRHLGAQARDVRREVALPGLASYASTEALAAQLLGDETSPSERLMKAETRARLESALEMLDEREREIIVLRHFEQLSNAESAVELGITEAAASKRYLRALLRLKGLLTTLGLDLTLLARRS